MYKISIYGCAMFKKLVCQWVNSICTFNSTGTEFLIQSATTQTTWTRYMIYFFMLA